MRRLPPHGERINNTTWIIARAAGLIHFQMLTRPLHSMLIPLISLSLRGIFADGKDLSARRRRCFTQKAAGHILNEACMISQSWHHCSKGIRVLCFLYYERAASPFACQNGGRERGGTPARLLSNVSAFYSSCQVRQSGDNAALVWKL